MSGVILMDFGFLQYHTSLQTVRKVRFYTALIHFLDVSIVRPAYGNPAGDTTLSIVVRSPHFVSEWLKGREPLIIMTDGR